MKYLVSQSKSKLIIPILLISGILAQSCSSNNLNHNLQPLSPRYVPVDLDAYVINNTDASSININEVQLPRTDGRNGERIAPLAVYQQAPFGGVLLNAEALVFLESSFREQAARCEIERRFRLGTLTNMSVRDITSLQSALEAQRHEANLLLNGRDREIEILQRHNANNWVQYLLYGGIGATIGFSVFSLLYFLTR